MKRFLTPLLFSLAALVAVSLPNRSSAQAGIGVEVSYQTFYDELSPYGEWIDYPEYGYVWSPSVGNDFRPYSTNGRWVWSDDYEWMWVSDYNWGWAPFHYGRWFQDPYYGWLWMPGYEWSPAWVAWRDGGDYYGWAPLRPGIHISVGFSLGNYNPPIDYWCFTPRRYIMSRSLYNHCLPRTQNITIINNTTIINNYSRRTNNVFVTGPRRADAERYVGNIRPVRFRDADRPGRGGFRNNTVNIYRPQVNRNNDRAIAPRQVSRYDNTNRSASINREQRVNRVNQQNAGRTRADINRDNRTDRREGREINNNNAGRNNRDTRISDRSERTRGERNREINQQGGVRAERPSIENRESRRLERPVRSERETGADNRNRNMRERPNAETRMPQRTPQSRPEMQQRPQRNTVERNRVERPVQRMEQPQRNREVRMERPSAPPRMNSGSNEQRRVERPSAPARENREIRRGGGRGN